MQTYLAELLTVYPLLAPAIFILIRSLGVLIPPVPGLVLDVVGIAAFGWLRGFVYATAGILLGSVAAFLIARRFRSFALRHIPFLRKAATLEEKLTAKTRFATLLVFRFLFNPLFDYASYAAGLSTVRLSHFTIATLIGVAPVIFIIYYTGHASLISGNAYLISFTTLLITLTLLVRESA